MLLVIGGNWTRLIESRTYFVIHTPTLFTYELLSGPPGDFVKIYVSVFFPVAQTHSVHVFCIRCVVDAGVLEFMSATHLNSFFQLTVPSC